MSQKNAAVNPKSVKKTPLQKIEELEIEIKSLQDNKKAEIERLQKKCEHPSDAIRGCSHESYEYLTSSPPIRVCTLCGYAEEGWGCGYLKLQSDDPVPILPRDFLWKKYIKILKSQEELNQERNERNDSNLND